MQALTFRLLPVTSRVHSLNHFTIAFPSRPFQGDVIGGQSQLNQLLNVGVSL